jgi:hypothetical protein
MRGIVEIYSGGKLIHKEDNLVVDGASELLADIMTVSPSLSGMEHSTSSLLDTSNYMIQAISFGKGPQGYQQNAHSLISTYTSSIQVGSEVVNVPVKWAQLFIDGEDASGTKIITNEAYVDLTTSSYVAAPDLPTAPTPLDKKLENNADLSASYVSSITVNLIPSSQNFQAVPWFASYSSVELSSCVTVSAPGYASGAINQGDIDLTPPPGVDVSASRVHFRGIDEGCGPCEPCTFNKDANDYPIGLKLEARDFMSTGLSAGDLWKGSMWVRAEKESASTILDATLSAAPLTLTIRYERSQGVQWAATSNFNVTENWQLIETPLLEIVDPSGFAAVQDDGEDFRFWLRRRTSGSTWNGKATNSYDSYIVQIAGAKLEKFGPYSKLFDVGFDISSQIPSNGQNMNVLPRDYYGPVVSAAPDTTFGYGSTDYVTASLLGCYPDGSAVGGTPYSIFSSVDNPPISYLAPFHGNSMTQLSGNYEGLFNSVSSMDISGFVNMAASSWVDHRYSNTYGSNWYDPSYSGLIVSAYDGFSSVSGGGEVQYIVTVSGSDLGGANLYGGIYNMGLWTIDVDKTLKAGNTAPFLFSPIYNPRKYKLFAKKSFSKNLCYIEDDVVSNPDSAGIYGYNDLRIVWRIRFL